MILDKITKRLFVAIVDFLILSFALYISICLRKLSWQNMDYFLNIYYPFLIIIFSTLIIFYMYGLYDKMTIKIYKDLNNRIISSLIFSSIIGSVIFYTSQSFSIAPKTILVIYIIVAGIFIFIWRRYTRRIVKSKRNQKILLVAEGKELIELKQELKDNKIINIQKVETMDLAEIKDLSLYTKIEYKVREEGFNILAINMHHPHIKNDIALFYELFLKKIEIINFANMYEEVFGKIPLENIDAGWFFSNIYNREDRFYTIIKRIIDLTISIPVFIFSLIFYPIIYIILKLQDNGSLFYTNERVGKNNKNFKVYKFRSMTPVKINEQDVSSKDESHRVTKFGSFIRKTRIDELPQLINIIKGDISLIGPRPELPKLVREYENQIAFYGVRHTIKPGLSGYAQIYQEQNHIPKFGIETNGTKDKLSYDIFYLKHRSILLDLSLIIKTIKNLLEKAGI